MKKEILLLKRSAASWKLTITYCLLFIVHCSLTIKTSHAQVLDSLVAKAVDNNLELKILEKEYLAALERAPQVSQLPDPELGVGVFPLPVETRLGAQIIRLGATQMIPWKGLLDGKKDLELAKAKALYERIAARALELSYEVEQAYFKLYEIEQSQKILQRNITILQTLEQLALAKVESGKSSAADVLRVQLKMEEIQQELMILETTKAKPISTINQLLFRSADMPIVTADSFSFANLSFDKKIISENIANHHPMLRMYELQQEVSRQALALNKLETKPSFGVGMDYILVNKRNDAEPSGNGRDIVQLRAAVKIPLYRKKYEAKEREENLKITALTDRKENLLRQFMSIIEKAFADHEIARLKVDLYQRQITITQSAIRILETNYSTSGKGFDELLLLEKELIDYDLKMLKAIVQSQLAKSSIERFMMQ